MISGAIIVSIGEEMWFVTKHLEDKVYLTRPDEELTLDEKSFHAIVTPIS